jgi:formiminotetrahydrofolate cyclodeaminase
MSRLFDLSVRELLDAAASSEPTPGGGSVAAITAACAAGLVTMAARNSAGDWQEAGAIAAQAATLRRRLEELAPENDEAYQRALAALGRPDELESGSRDEAIGASLERAAAIPLAIAEVAANVAELAAVVAEEGDQRSRGDAAAAAMLALGATRAAAHLVEINLGVRELDERRLRANRLAADAAAASARTLAAHS